MTHPLDDSRELLASAMEEINDLEKRMQQFVDSHPVKIEFDSIVINHVINARLRLNKPIGPFDEARERKWGVAADEITGKMRSALDHAVYRLSEHDQAEGFHPEQPKAKTQFPIFASRSAYFSGKVHEVDLAGLTKQHKKIIDSMQPFQRGARVEADRDILLDLHALDNRKKHRETNVGFLTKVGGFGEITIKAIKPSTFSGAFQLTIAPFRFEDGAIAAQIRLPPRVGTISVQHDKSVIQFDAFFGDRKVSLQRLKEIHGYVYWIMTRLDPLFD